MPKVEYIVTVKVDDVVDTERVFTLDAEMNQGDKDLVLRKTKGILVHVYEDIFRASTIEEAEHELSPISEDTTTG